MRKTLLVTSDFYPNLGGIANYWAQLGTAMSSDTWVVLAPSLQKGKTELNSRYTLYRKSFISRIFLPRWFPLLLHTWHIFRKERIEVLIAAQILPVGTVCFILRIVFKIPYVVSAHGMDIMLPLKNPWKRFLAQCILQGAEKVIANSAFTAYHLSTYGISEKNIEIVYPCPMIVGDNLIEPSEIITPSILTCEGKKVLLTVGRLVRRKGHEYIIRALKDIREAVPDTMYVIVGEGPMHYELQQLALSLDLTQNVVFTGPLSNDDVMYFMKRCDVFIMTPVNLDGDVEGFGIVYLEAGLQGKPVVASRSGGIQEAVVDGDTGILVDEKNSDQIRDAILKLFSDDAFAKKLGEQGRERVLRDFKIEREGEKLQKVLSMTPSPSTLRPQP